MFSFLWGRITYAAKALMKGKPVEKAELFQALTGDAPLYRYIEVNDVVLEVLDFLAKPIIEDPDMKELRTRVSGRRLWIEDVTAEYLTMQEKYEAE